MVVVCLPGSERVPMVSGGEYVEETHALIRPLKVEEEFYLSVDSR